LIVAIASIACNRLILSLRGFYFQRGVVTTTNMMTTPSFGGAVHIKMDRLNRERTSRPHIRGMTARRSSQPRNDTFDRQLETVEYRGSAPLQDDDTVVVSGVSAPSTSSQPSR
ncbi:5284_t:CDS:2, partial [Acaulospora colombiana]